MKPRTAQRTPFTAAKDPYPDSVYEERARIALAVYHRVVLPDDFLPWTCAGSSAVLQGVLRELGHRVRRTGVTPVEYGPDGEQVHVVLYDDRNVYDLTYTQFRRLRKLDGPVIPRKVFETRFLLLPTLSDPLMCDSDFYSFYVKPDQVEEFRNRTGEGRL